MIRQQGSGSKTKQSRDTQANTTIVSSLAKKEQSSLIANIDRTYPNEKREQIQ